MPPPRSMHNEVTSPYSFAQLSLTPDRKPFDGDTSATVLASIKRLNRHEISTFYDAVTRKLVERLIKVEVSEMGTAVSAVTFFPVQTAAICRGDTGHRRIRIPYSICGLSSQLI